METTVTTTERRYLRVAQILHEYGLPRDRLYAALRSGELRSINVGSESKKSYLVQRSAVEQWLDRLTVGAS